MNIHTNSIPGTPLWGLFFSYAPAVAELVKTVPGIWWSPTHRAWVGYRDAIARARVALKADHTLTGEVPRSNDWEGDNFPFPLAGSQLANYQKEAVKFCLARAEEGAILGLAPGAGKSAVFLTVARALRQRTVVIAPAPVRSSWTMPDKEMGQVRRWWLAAYKHMVIADGTTPGTHDWHFYKREEIWRCKACQTTAGGGPDCNPSTLYFPPCTFNLPTADTKIVVIHYDIVHAWLSVLLAWGPRTLGIDEGHLLANPKSRRSKAVAELAASCRYKIILTGTPLTNRPQDLYGVVEAVSPGRFGGAFVDRETGVLQTRFPKYGVRYCAGHQKQIPGKDMKVVWDWSGASHEKELARRMEFMMLYRTKEQLGIELPPIRTIVVELDVSAKYVTRLSGDFFKNKKAVRASLAAAADGKFGQAVQGCIDDASAGHKKVAFTHRRSIAEAMAVQLNAKGIAADFIHGEVPQAKRDEILTRARNHVGGFVLCCTIDTCGTGIDLTFAAIADFVELTYEPHKIIQARARLHRRRQKNNVLVRVLIAKGTTDDLIKEYLLKKIQTFEKIIGDTDDDIGSDLDNSPKGQACLDELYEMLKKREREDAA
jgi:hypothetical protein